MKNILRDTLNMHLLVIVAFLLSTISCGGSGSSKNKFGGINTENSSGGVNTEMLSVPANGAKIYSSVLTTGQNYQIKAEGTYVAWTYPGGPYLADAEWRELQDNSWVDQSVHDLLVNGADVNWGGYSSSHTYIIYRTGTGQRMSFNIYDSYYGDNSGSLTVTITRN